MPNVRIFMGNTSLSPRLLPSLLVPLLYASYFGVEIFYPSTFPLPRKFAESLLQIYNAPENSTGINLPSDGVNIESFLANVDVGICSDGMNG
jgi:hypothetical protein